jgi:hypothetical protein
MEEKNNKNNVLASWKEIASYLNCGVRTCIRWEKEQGLPIHRMEGKPKSSVYAYRQELDEWLGKKLNTNNVKKKQEQSPLYSQKSLYIILPVFLIVVAYFVISEILKPPKVHVETVTPQSTGPLTLQDSDIITTEFDAAGRLRVWRKGDANSYKEVWRIEPVRHSSFAVGDVDNDNNCEIVAPGLCRIYESVAERKRAYYQYFINVYKQEVNDWWKSTYFDNADCVFEDERYDLTEMAIGNLDGNTGNEIVLITRSNLAIFKYSTEEHEVRLLRSRDSFLDNVSLFLKSVVVKNIDADDSEEIIVSADERIGNEITENKGWILIFKYQDNWPELFKSIRVDANCSFQSVRIGDVIKGGDLEIVTPVYRKIGDAWNTFVTGWNTNGDKIFDKAIYTRGDYQYQTVHLDVGNILPEQGDEIIVANQFPDELIIYYWNGTRLVENDHFPLHPSVGLTKVFLSRSESKSDSSAEIITCGGCFNPDIPGDFYLEAIRFDKEEFYSRWNRMGGDKKELRVSYAGFGKKRE